MQLGGGHTPPTIGPQRSIRTMFRHELQRQGALPSAGHDWYLLTTCVVVIHAVAGPGNCTV